MTPVPEAKERLFFALWPSEAIVDDIRKQFQSVCSDTVGRLIPSANWHLTLCFLGSVSVSQKISLINAVDQRTLRPFGFELDTIRFLKRAQMVWLQANVVPTEMLELVKHIQTSATQCQLVLEERTFLAHLTLMRKVANAAKLPKTISPITWNARQFALVRSQTHADGAEYETLRRWDLQ